MKKIKVFFRGYPMLLLLLLFVMACSKENSMEQELNLNQQPTNPPILAMGDTDEGGGDTNGQLTDCNCTFTRISATAGTNYLITLPEGPLISPVTSGTGTFSANSDEGFRIRFQGVSGQEIEVTYTINCGGADYTRTQLFDDGLNDMNENTDVYYLVDESCNVSEGCGCRMTVNSVSWLILPTVDLSGPFPELVLPEYNQQWTVDNPNPSIIDMLGSPGPLPSSDSFILDGDFSFKFFASFPDEYHPDLYEVNASVTVDCGENSVDKFIVVHQNPQEITRGSTEVNIEFEEGCRIKTFPF